MESKSVLPSKLAILSLVLIASGCDSVNSYIEQGKVMLGLAPPPAPAKSSTESSAEADMELIGEMYRVIFLRPTLATSERETVSRLADTLAQGASLEGLYNGLTHSADYRKLEGSYRGGMPVALSYFSNLLAGFEMDLPTPTAFDASSAEPLAAPVEPTYRQDFPEDRAKPTTAAPAHDAASLAASYTVTFRESSFFTLKRVCGDEALKAVSVRGADKEKLALWYSKWAVQTSKMGIDFGLPLRNSTDEDFHYRFAKAMPLDRLKWEVLNRVHRILNAGGYTTPKGKQ